MASVRKFIRHPSDIPIKVSELDECDVSTEGLSFEQVQMNNVSLGGLAFFSPQAFHIDHHVMFSVPCLGDTTCIEGSVLWCKTLLDGFEIGLEFDDPQAVFHLRMIEQICHIEHYRKEIQRVEGRTLTSEEAALEWIKQFASDFPNFDSSSDL